MTPPVTRRRALAGAASLLAAPFLARPGLAQSPLEITVAGGEFRPIALALAPLIGAAPAAEATEVIRANLANSGLFRPLDSAAFLQRPASIDEPPRFADWRAINAEAVVFGDVEPAADGRLRVRFRLYDVPTAQQVEGLQFMVDPAAWRRAAHKVSDAIYSRLTGEEGYFDSRIVFVDERGGKGDRVKRLALMDQDGANLRYLTDGRELVLTPRFSPTDQEILYLSFATGEPQVFLLNLDTGQREALGRFPGMSFSPRFSPDGRSVALSLAQDGSTDLYMLDLASRSLRRLTRAAAIDTAPSFSPDGRRLAFESDRGGGSQIYVMELAGGEATAQRISFGTGRYGTPVWSPRGDTIAFTRSQGGQFSVGVMGVDGSGERILDATFHSEGPSWAPNGRVLSFFRESPGEGGASSIWSVDVTGINLRRLPTPGPASDPAWSPLLP